MTTTDLTLVETPTGPTTPAPAPKPDKRQLADTVGALVVLTGALTGLAWTSMTDPDYALLALAAAMAAAVIGAVVSLTSGDAR